MFLFLLKTIDHWVFTQFTWSVHNSAVKTFYDHFASCENIVWISFTRLHDNFEVCPPPSCIIELFSLFHNGLITKKCKFKLLYVVRSKGCGAKNAAGCPVPIFSYFSYFLSLFLFSPIFILKPPICPIFYLVKPKFVTKLKMEL